MIAFQSVLPELAAREVRCVRVGPGSGPGLPPNEYAFLEYYCENLACDCRLVFLQVLARNWPGRVLASINYGWDKEKFYRKRFSKNPGASAQIVQAGLDPIHPQSEHAAALLEVFRHLVLDEAYRLRLQTHYELLRREVARLSAIPGGRRAGRV